MSYPRKSLAEHRLEGTYKPHRHDKRVKPSLVTVDDVLPTTPPRSLGLSKVAAGEWKRLLTQVGSLQKAQMSALVAYTTAYSNWKQAQAAIDKYGVTVEVPITNRSTGNIVGHKLSRNPACAVVDAERKAMLAAAKILGLFSSDEEETDDQKVYSYEN
jgi:P27 family predicted phage terminase small subunit